MEPINNLQNDSLNTTLVQKFASQKTEEPSVSLKNVESLLGTIASNQVLMFAELKRKNKYEAWKTFFAGVKLFVYIAIIYVSYLGALQLMEKLESGALMKNLVPQINLEEMISSQNSNNGISNILQNFQSQAAENTIDSDNIKNLNTTNIDSNSISKDLINSLKSRFIESSSQ